MAFSICFALSFLIGAIPNSLLLVWAFHKKDIRKCGSGNPGATNVFRSIGKKTGLVVLALDAFKGWLPVVLFSTTVIQSHANVDPLTLSFYLGAAAILGHVFSPYLKFKGGKGVATSAGVGLAVYPVPFAMSLFCWAIILKLTRKMSIASIAAAWIFSLLSIFLLPNNMHKLITVIIASLITWTHRTNIRRLQSGQEPNLF